MGGAGDICRGESGCLFLSSPFDFPWQQDPIQWAGFTFETEEDTGEEEIHHSREGHEQGRTDQQEELTC